MLRKLVMELSLKDLGRNLKEANLKSFGKTTTESSGQQAFSELQGLNVVKMLQKVKKLEMQHLLRFDQDGFAAIIKVETKHSSDNVEDVMSSILEIANGKLQLLEKEKEGAYTYFVKGKLPNPSLETNSKKIMYPVPPFSFKEGKFRYTLLGDSRQLKELLETFNTFGLRYKIISLMDARFSPSSPISRLTEKQREAINLAFKLGYFDTPRKINVEQLATKLSLASSTLAVHLRRAEKRLLAIMLSEETQL